MTWFTHASRFVFGDSLHAIRLLSAVAFRAEVLLTGFHHAGTRREALDHIARIRLGAARSGHPRQRHASFHESLEPLFWMGCIYIPAPRNQPATSKIAIVVRSAVGLRPREQAFDGVLPERACRGLLATPRRRLLTSKWFWIAAVIAFAIAFPNVAWEYQHHFPTLEDLRNVRAIHKNVELPPLPFIGQQILVLAPVSALVWIA
jgi:hypothetical protein